MPRDKPPWPFAPAPAPQRPLEFSIRPPLYGKRAWELKHKSWLSDFEESLQALEHLVGGPVVADLGHVRQFPGLFLQVAERKGIRKQGTGWATIAFYEITYPFFS